MRRTLCLVRFQATVLCLLAAIAAQGRAEPAQPIIAEHYVICPVTSDLQRILLNDDVVPTVCVLIDGSAFRNVEKLDRYHPLLEDLLNKLSEFPRETNDPVLFQSIDAVGNVEESEARHKRLEELSKVAEEVGYYAGFLQVKSSQTFHPQDFQWPKFLQEAQATAELAKSQNESAIGDAQLQVIPVRTLLSRLLTPADCVANFTPVIRGNSDFPGDLTERLTELVPQLKYARRQAILLRVRHDKEGRSVVDKWVEQIGERKKFAEQFGFEECNVSARTDDQPLGLTQGISPQLEFHLKVVGPNGEPVPEPKIRWRANPGGSTPLASYVDGKFIVKLSGHPNWFNFIIEQPGYAPYYGVWDAGDHPEVLPREFTAHLEKAWRVGGIIVDELGRPLGGVKIHPSIRFTTRPDDNNQIHTGTEFYTDDEGRWTYDCVPDSLDVFHAEISHPDYMSGWKNLARGVYELAAGEEPQAKFELEPGAVIEGRITDEQGNPIVEAVVRAKAMNTLRTSTTDADGKYQLTGFEPGRERVVVSAAGKALEMKEVQIAFDMEPVDFVLKPGGHVRVRVVDEKGNGIPQTRIFFQEWRGRIDYFEFDGVHDRTDENGIWEWNEAPLDEFKADICRPGEMQLLEQSLTAREEEYVFHPPKALVISGSVVDAETGDPIEKFTVTPGIDYEQPERDIYWYTTESYEGSEGHYRVRINRGYPGHLVRIEAAGYRAATSRKFRSDEGEVTYDFRLEPAEDISARVLTPAGKPAAGAKIALGIAGVQISIKNGSFDGSTYANQLEVDDEGKFQLPNPSGEFELVVLHPDGFAHVKSAEGRIPAEIRLTAWARAEGTFRVGAEVVPNVELTISGAELSSYGQGRPRIFTHQEAMTGAQGDFVFERVFPGRGRIGRSILRIVDQGAMEVTSALQIPVEFKAGETTSIKLGGTGRPVVGLFQPSPEFEGEPRWSFGSIFVRTGLAQPEVPYPEEVRKDNEKLAAWWKEWSESPAGKEWKVEYQQYEKLRDASPVIHASISQNGSFRLDDVPPGNYVLQLRFDQHSAGTLEDYRFTVPELKAERIDKPLDLGTIVLQ